MDLKQFEYFVQVADLGSFTKASTLLNIAQPALSRQVRSLEVELRQNLLYRNGRGVTLSDAGKRFIEHARGILQQVDRARDEMAQTMGTPVGRVSVAAPMNVEKFLTVPLVKRFRSQFPSAGIDMIGSQSFFITELVVTGRIDIGLAHDPQPSAAIEIIPFMEEELFLICPHASARKAAPTGPVSLKDLPRYPLIIPSRPSAVRTLVDTELAKAGVKPHVEMEINSAAATLGLVKEGYGYAVLANNALRGEPPGRFQVRRFAEPLLIHLALVVSAQRPATPLIRMTVDLIRDIGPAILAPKSTAKSRVTAG